MPPHFFLQAFLSCFCWHAVPNAQSRCCFEHLLSPQQTGHTLMMWNTMTNSPVSDVLCRCHHYLYLPPAWPAVPRHGPYSQRTMLPQVAGSIWGVSLGAERRSVVQSAGEAAGVGEAVLSQMGQGSQMRMKALKIKRCGKNPQNLE